MAARAYPLTTSPWITVSDVDTGDFREVGITEALTRAHQLRLVMPDSDGIVILRLLAAFYDAACGPATTEEWDAAWAAPTLDAGRVTAYADTWAHRLDLFHPIRPAFQCAGLTQYHRSASALDPSQLGGDSGAWFSTALRMEPVLGYPAWDPAEATVRLLWMLAYDVAGIKRAAPGDPAGTGNRIYGSHVGPVAGITHLHLSGHTLKDTLLLSLPPQPRAPGDAPVWEQEGPPSAARTREALGRLDRLTWPARRIRLHVSEEGTVDQVAFHDGDRLAGTSPEMAVRSEELDPMSLWKTTKKGLPFPLSVSEVGFNQPWTAALALDDAHSDSARSAALRHAVAAAQRGVLADTVIQVTVGEIIHGSVHRSHISDDLTYTVPLGTGADLADDDVRTSQARRARRAAWTIGALRRAVRDIAQQTLGKRLQSRIILSDLDRAWEESVQTQATDPDGTRVRWGTALHDKASDLINSLPLRPQDKEKVLAEYRSKRSAVQPAAVQPSDVPAPETPAHRERDPRTSEASTARGRSGRPPAVLYEWAGQKLSLSKIAQLPECEVTYQTLRERIKRGEMSLYDAVTTPSQRGPKKATGESESAKQD